MLTNNAHNAWATVGLMLRLNSIEQLEDEEARRIDTTQLSAVIHNAVTDEDKPVRL